MRDKLVRGSPSPRVTAVIGKPRRYPPGGFCCSDHGDQPITRSPDRSPPGGPFVPIRRLGDIPIFWSGSVGTAGILDPTIPVWHSPGSPTSPVLACWGGGALGLCPSRFPILATSSRPFLPTPPST